MVSISSNPHYFKDDVTGGPIYFIGYYIFSFHRDSSSNWRSLLDHHNQYKINYVRIFNDVKDAGGYSKNPYQRVAGTYNPKGHEKFDLTKWEETFWAEFNQFLVYAQSKKVYVHLSLWDHISYKNRTDEWAWPGSGWNIDNNVNGTLFGDIDRNNDGYATGSTEFYDYDALINNTTNIQRLNVATYQKKYIDRLILESGKYNNVFYEIGNEVSASYNWISYWVDYVKQKLIEYGYNQNIPITVDDDHAIGYEPLTETAHPVNGATYHQAGVSGDNLTSSWPSNIYLYNKWFAADTDGNPTASPDANLNRKGAWIALTQGGHWLNYSDNGEAWVYTNGTTTYDFSGKATYWKYLQEFIINNNIPFWDMTPQNTLTSKGNILANVSRGFYILYTTSGGSFTINLASYQGLLNAKWYNPRTGTYQGQTTIQGGTQQLFTSPDTNDWVLYIFPCEPSICDVIITQ